MKPFTTSIDTYVISFYDNIYMLWYLSTCEDNHYKVYIQNSWNKFWCISQWKDIHHKLYSENDITYFGTNYNRKKNVVKKLHNIICKLSDKRWEKDKKIENVEIIMIINLMGRNPILELDVNIFWLFSKYVLKMITITYDTWSKYPGLWWRVEKLTIFNHQPNTHPIK
jgi:hypothetical protein